MSRPPTAVPRLYGRKPTLSTGWAALVKSSAHPCSVFAVWAELVPRCIGGRLQTCRHAFVGGAQCTCVPQPVGSHQRGTAGCRKG